MKEIFDTLNSLSPAGLAALLGYIIYQLILQKKNDKVVADNLAAVKDNHLSGLPELEQSVRDMTTDVRKMLVLIEGQTSVLNKLNDHVVYLVARSNRYRDGNGGANDQN